MSLGNKRKKIMGPTRTRSKSTKHVVAGSVSNGPAFQDGDVGDSAGDACSDDGVASVASDVDGGTSPGQAGGRLSPNRDR